MKIRTWVSLGALVFAMSAPLHAADPVEMAPQPVPGPTPPPVVQPDTAAQRVELGQGISLPREVFEELAARPDGLAMLERIHEQSVKAERLQGVPHLLLIFVSVLAFFGLAMLYFHHKHALMHRTLQLMVEKGVPLPVELLRTLENSESDADARRSNAGVAPVWASNLLWGGLLWITIGVTGMLYLWMRGSDAWPWAIAAIVYGAGSVLTAVAKQRKPG